MKKKIKAKVKEPQATRPSFSDELRIAVDAELNQSEVIKALREALNLLIEYVLAPAEMPQSQKTDMAKKLMEINSHGYNA